MWTDRAPRGRKHLFPSHRGELEPTELAEDTRHFAGSGNAARDLHGGGWSLLIPLSLCPSHPAPETLPSLRKNADSAEVTAQARHVPCRLLAKAAVLKFKKVNK